MKVKVLICNCKGLCPSFKDADMNTLPFHLESEMDIQYAVLHPMTCGQGGNIVLTELLREAASSPDTYIVSAACAPKVQDKLFKKVLRKAGFDEKRFVPVDIRGTDNEGITKRLKETVEALALEVKKSGRPSRTAAQGAGSAVSQP